MKIWIDATHPNCFSTFLGRTVLEYQLRVIKESERQLRALTMAQSGLNNLTHAREALKRFFRDDVRPTEIRVELPASADVPQDLPKDLLSDLNVVWSQRDESIRSRLQQFLREADGDPVVAFSGDSIIDVRLLEHFIWDVGNTVWTTGEGSGRVAIMRLTAPLADEPAEVTEAEDFASVAERAKETSDGPIKPFKQETFTTWIHKLRRHLDPYLIRVDGPETARKAERFLFDSNYKGATDFMTRYAYPPIVWAIVKPLAARRVHPNWVTSISILATALSMPLFAMGLWIPGLICSYVMSILDSVDGKLARLTFTSTAQGDTLDHGLDIVHPPLWYFAWAWGLTGGDPYSLAVTASGAMFLLYMFDRILETLFKASTGESVHGYRPLDVKMRTFISRRNVNLAIFTVALPLGLGLESFYFIVGWQAFSAAFHLTRVVTFWNARSSSDEVAPGVK